MQVVSAIFPAMLHYGPCRIPSNVISKPFPGLCLEGGCHKLFLVVHDMFSGSRSGSLTPICTCLGMQKACGRSLVLKGAVETSVLVE